jgi:hypothetical protein
MWSMSVASKFVRCCLSVITMLLFIVGVPVVGRADDEPVLIREADLRGERIQVFEDSRGERTLVRRPGAAQRSAVDAPAPAAWALGPAWTMRVERSGLQRVSGAALTAVGAPTEFMRLCLRMRGQVMPMHLRDADGDGVVDAAEEFVFYVGAVGSRYDGGEIIWLTDEPACHRAMAIRVANSAGEAINAALQRGELRRPAQYSASQGGPDGDHWFNAKLVSGMAWTTTTAGDLPLIPGTTQFTMTGATSTTGVHGIVLSGEGWGASTMWSGYGVFTRSVTAIHASAVLTAASAYAGDAVLLDVLMWERPVALRYGGAGGVFVAPVDGTYVVSGTWVYDVSDPSAASAIYTPGGVVDAGAGRTILVVGGGTATQIVPAAYSPSADVTTARNVAAVYVAPADWLDELETLLQHRRAVGVTATAVPVEALYAQFGDGRRSPYAIRDFLRYAYDTWAVKPTGVVLVGDASFDVRDYLGWGFATPMPTFLLDVDPSLANRADERGEAACDACFAQLDGDDPLSDLLPDLIFGRIPAQSAAQVSAYVQKVLAYEAPIVGAGENQWRSTLLYVVDNEIRPDGSVDPAGDFWRSADESIVEQNLSARVVKLYYDPTGARGKVPYTVGAPYTETQVSPPYQRTRALFERGAALVNYIGHGSVNRIGDLDSDVYDNYFLHQDDADSLRTAGRLPILLQMTCRTADFTFAYKDAWVQQAHSFDERMVLASQGAIAAWGSTAYGITRGHDQLLKGFYDALWGAGGDEMTLGALAERGYLRVLEKSDDIGVQLFRTYDIIGDPFLRPQVWTSSVLMPLTSRRNFVPQIAR